MELSTFDHVALWVAGRDAMAAEAEKHLGVHLVERTDRFTLVGADARRGKLTLFEAEGPREAGALVRVGLRVRDLERARAALPAGSADELDLGEGLRVRLVEDSGGHDYDLDHVRLAVRDPAAAAAGWQALGFREAEPVGDVARVEVAGAYLELVEGDAAEPERPLLNHLGVLVESADAWRGRAEAAGAEIADVVDAPNTYAVFVWGPDRVKLEYVEHKPTFSLE